jgi:hypothetical protein
VALGVFQVFARMSIQRRWRAWLTDSVVSRWPTDGRYYQPNLVSGDHENPEYRIAEDLRVATDAPVDSRSGGNLYCGADQAGAESGSVTASKQNPRAKCSQR